MQTIISPEHAEYNAKIREEARREWAKRHGFEDPPSGNNGWIEPDGTLLPNHYTTHCAFCNAWFGKSEGEVEETHVKLSAGNAYFAGKRLTSKQAKTLLELDYDPKGLEFGGVTTRYGY